ncbi:MAG TPA: TonB-dependent receptor [Thermoanaerobaculia bacterium]|nr:TonB-dependent receptor [Thermoanaerobaculia bacterium]
MKLFTRFTALAALLLLVGLPAFAQTTVSLTGQATTDGAPLPGVTVTISSPQMQGTRTTVTGDAGGFSFGAIPPGEFTVKFELSGMATQTKRVKIGVGQTGRADADLKVAAVAEAITVTAAAPSVLETPSVSANLQAKQVEQLPVQRNVLATALLAPGVNDNTPSGSQLSISGSPGYDNLVMVNGVAITENIRHQSLNLFIEDAIQETTVLTGAISAEYGGFTGGVVNSITKSGGNQFSGSLRDSLTNNAWQEKTPLQKANNTKLVSKLNSVYEGTLGGFILKDRLWFFGAGRKTTSTTQSSLRTVPLGDATRSALEFASATDEKRWEGKLTGQVTAKHNLSASYLDLKRTIDKSAFSAAATYDFDSLAPRRDPQKLKQAHYNGVLTNNWMLEAQYSAMDWGVALGNGAQFTDFVRGTLVRNRADGNARFYSPTFCGVCDKETRSNDGWNVKSNYFISSKGWGNQNIVGGIERFAEHRFANNYQSGSNFRLFVNSVQRLNGVLYPTITPGRASSAAFIIWTPIFALQQRETDFGSDALFVNDRWDLNEHWSFSLGARYDKNIATDTSGTKVSDDHRITPRLNATFDPAGNGRNRITASYAQYASRIVDGNIGSSGSSAGNPATIYFSYLGPAINPAGTPNDQLLDTAHALQIVNDWLTKACNAQGQCGTANLDLLRPNTGAFVPGYSGKIDKALNSPYVQEYTIGYGAQWAQNVVTRIDLVSRDWKAFYGFRVDQSTPQSTDPLGIKHDVSILENTNDITRKYRGLQFQGNWRPGRFNVGVNYTYSTLKGNDEQESVTSGTIGNTPGALYYPELSNYSQFQPSGYLAQDERHRMRAWVGYDVPMPRVLGALNISLLQSYDSALPYSAVQNVDLTSYLGTLLPANSRYVGAPAARQYYFSKRGEFRVDNINSTNLSLNYRYPISRFELYGEAQMLNVFNADGVALPGSIRTTVSTANTSSNFAPFNPFTDTPKECPQGTAGATCKAGGYNFQKAADFGKPTSSAAYQQPRLWRASFGVRF